MVRVLVGSLLSTTFLVAAVPAAAQDSVAVVNTVSLSAAATTPEPSAPEAWMVDRSTRPTSSAVKALFGSYLALQALDVYSTTAALKAGAHEANPIMDTNPAQAMGIKALMGLTTYYTVHKMAKKNRKGAIVTMVILNGVTAAVVANNVKNSRQ